MTEKTKMTSLEGLLRELFMRVGAWKRVLWGAVLTSFLLGFGYLRSIIRAPGTPELPVVRLDKDFVKSMLSALPLGAFYTLVPLFMAWGVQNLLSLCQLGILSSIAWGLGVVASLSLTAVALAVVEDDPERFFLGLEFEKVLSQWWGLKAVWGLPAFGCWGLVALLGPLFYGLGGFVGVAFLGVYISAIRKNLRYS